MTNKGNNTDFFDKFLKVYSETNTRLSELNQSLNTLAGQIHDIPKETTLDKSLKILKKEASEYLQLAFKDAKLVENFENIISKLDNNFTDLRKDLSEYKEFVDFLKNSKLEEMKTSAENKGKVELQKLDNEKLEIEQDFKAGEAKKDRKLKIWLLVIPIVAGAIAAIWKLFVSFFTIVVK